MVLMEGQREGRPSAEGAEQSTESIRTGVKGEDRIRFLRDRRTRGPVPVSLVIVTYKNGRGLLDCLRSVQAQSIHSHEVIIVDNGGTGRHADRIDGNHLYLRLDRNHGLNAGRNIGTAFTSSDIIAFLDDDCILDEEYLKNSLQFMEKTGCIGFRGRIRARTYSRYNLLQSHYDLGKVPFPYLLNTEGNCVLRKQCLTEVGGWEESLEFAGGHEGLLLSFRLANRYGREGLYYFPGAVIQHDFSDSFLKIVKKDLRHEVFYRKLILERPELEEFRKSYGDPVCNRGDKDALEEGWDVRLIRSARNQILSRPMVKRFLYRYFYDKKGDAFRELGKDLIARVLRG